MLEGLELTLKQMDNVFEKFAIRVVAPEPGEKLDPERHQAMSIQESSDIEPNHILSMIQKGYTLQDRLIRPAMVIVAKAAEPAASEPPEQEKA
jgi:molecular chaperone GrpE